MSTGARGSAGHLASALLVGAGVLLRAAPAPAEDKVYSPLVEGGEIAVELRAHQDFDGAASRDGAQHAKSELEWAPTDRWLTSLGLECARDFSGASRTRELSFENVLQLLTPGAHWLNASVLIEYAHPLVAGEPDALQLGLLLQKELGRHLLTGNVLAERSVSRSAETLGTYAIQYRYLRPSGVEPGIEAYGDFGASPEAGTSHTHPLTIGPALFARVHYRPGRVLKLEGAVLLGLNAASPDLSARALLELELR